MEKCIELYHGNGGTMSHQLIENLFVKHFSKDRYLGEDSAFIEVSKEVKRLAYTTDSYVISPIFFKGGDIGKLAVTGTINDLAVSFARPLYLSCGFIIEEGLPMHILEQVVKSMAYVARSCNVKIITGDTKVVPRGEVDKIYINTSGIGEVIAEGLQPICEGDKIIITGNIGDHGTSILLTREQLDFECNVISDCAPLNFMLNELVQKLEGHIKLMKDPTRGGVATTLNEMSLYSGKGMQINEESLPIAKDTKAVCELLGLDPLYLANEGKALMIVESGYEEEALKILRQFEIGKDSRIIGEVIKEKEVLLRLNIGTHKVLKMLYDEQLPRIC